MKASFVMSGKCRIGDVGEPTSLKDYNSEDLFVGDIVIVYSNENSLIDSVSLSVVCSDKWTSYSNDVHEAKETDIEYYVMGIKDVDFMDNDSIWNVKKVKSCDDIIIGEKWEHLGINYL